MSFVDLDLTLYARAELSGRRRSEGGTSLPDTVEATMGRDHVHGNAYDGRQHADGNGSVTPGGDSVGATVPRSVGRD